MAPARFSESQQPTAENYGATVSPMQFRNEHVGMGGAREREFQLTLTDVAALRATIAAARGG
jgi:hypothetical protein